MISFRLGLAIVSCALVLLPTALAVGFARYDIRQVLADELEQRGITTAEHLASDLTAPLQFRDDAALRRAIDRAMSTHMDAVYVLATGPTGQIVASTCSPGFSAAAAKDARWARGTRLRRFLDNGRLVLEIVVPILGGSAGSVSLGLSDRRLEAMVSRHVRSLWPPLALALLFGFCFAVWVSGILTRPLGQLLAGVQSVGRGDLGRRIRVPLLDEFGKLAKAFNAMAEALDEHERVRQKLLESVVGSQEEERKRVARDLHDDVAQALISARWALETCQEAEGEAPEAYRRAVASAFGAITAALNDTRRLIRDLRPGALDDLGLVPAIGSYAESRLSHGSCRVELAVGELPESLPPTFEVALFRIVQEAITNAGKHASAKNVRIELSAGEGVLRGSIVDDGVGFRPDDAVFGSGEPGGVGLAGMRERAAILGGSLQVTSEPDHGTAVSFAIPLPAPTATGKAEVR